MERALRLAGIIGAIVLVLLIVGFVLAAVFNVLLDVLYIFLIILAAFTLFATALNCGNTCRTADAARVFRQGSCSQAG